MTVYMKLITYFEEDNEDVYAMFSVNNGETVALGAKLGLNEDKWDKNNFFGCYYIDEKTARKAALLGAFFIFDLWTIQDIMETKSIKLWEKHMDTIADAIGKVPQIEEEIQTHLEEIKKIATDRLKKISPENPE